MAACHAERDLRLARTMRIDLHVVTLNNALHRGPATGDYCGEPLRSLDLVSRLSLITPAPIVVLTGFWREGLDRRACAAGVRCEGGR